MKRTRKNKWMKFISLGIAAAILAGCSSTNGDSEQTGTEQGADQQSFKIGISQLVNHKALNDAKDGFEERLAELGLDVTIDFDIADADVPTSQLIAEKFVSDKVDLIYAIATPAAQTAQNATKDSGTPVIFSAVTDPEKAGLVGADIVDNNITGVTDVATEENTIELLNTIKELRNDKNAVGIIYNTAETNAVSQVETIERLGEELGIAVVPVPIAGLTDIDSALEIVSTKADALYLITDNMVASSVDMVAAKAKEKNLITVSTDSAHVESGALFSIGLSYKQLGRQAADMAKSILVDGVAPSEIPVEGSQKLFRFINKSAAEALGIDIETLKTEDTTIIE